MMIRFLLLPFLLLPGYPNTTPGLATLPEADGTLQVPSQEWRHSPGERTLTAYIYYPGGKLENVGQGTGLMLSLHNWGGTHWVGTASPEFLANRYDVVAICVDYLQSGKMGIEREAPYDFGFLQAIDALLALHSVFEELSEREIPFHRGRIYACGGSGGGNVSLMANKLAPRTFACIVDMSGMAKLSDDIAFGLPEGSRLNAGYSQDPASPFFLTKDQQEIRFVGCPAHLLKMRELGNACKVIVSHGSRRTSRVRCADHFRALCQIVGWQVQRTRFSEEEPRGISSFGPVPGVVVRQLIRRKRRDASSLLAPGKGFPDYGSLRSPRRGSVPQSSATQGSLRQLLLLRLHRIRLGVGILPNSGHHPGDLQARRSSADLEPVVVDLFGDVDRCESTDTGELIAELGVGGLEAVRQLHRGFSPVV